MVAGVYFIALAVAVALAEPCANYTALDDSHRSVSYISDGSVVICDYGRIVQGNWYRFTSYAGGTMPEEPVPLNSCGTIYPIWMNGTHPDENEPGPLEVEVCVNGGNDCDLSMSIRVQWCQDDNNEYFVYELAPVTACDIAYCAGSLTACEYNKVWNEYQNACVDEYPQINGTIILSDPVEPNDPLTEKFHFECHIPYQSDIDDGARFLVTWLFNGSNGDSVPETVVSSLPHIGELSEDYLRGNLGKQLSCRVKAFWEGIDIYGPPHESNSYWMGIQSTGDIIAVEGDGVVTTDLISTLPITCGCCPGVQNCFYTFKVSELTSMKFFDCSYSFTVAEPNATLQVEAEYTTGTGQPRQFDIEFSPLQEVLFGSHKRIWDGYAIEPVRVTIRDEMQWRSCNIYGDPYIETMDWIWYEMTDIGQFYILKTNTEFEIQGRFKECESGAFASCLCAIAVRYRNTVLGVDACDDIYDVKTFQKLINTEVSSGYFENHGDFFVMYLGSDFSIDIYINDWIIMEAYIQMFVESGTSSGLCGRGDDDWQNEFYPMENYDYENFYDHYRIPDGFSFFDGVYECNNYVTVDKPCTCDKVSQELTCGFSDSNVEYNFGDVCSLDKRKKRAIPKRLHERSTDGQYADNTADFFTVMDYSFVNEPSNFPVTTWPTSSGITELQAEEWCLTVLQESPAYELCALLIDIGSLIKSCKSDIKITDNLNTAYTKVTTLEKNCTFVAEASQVYGSEHNETEAIELIESIRAKICPNLCSFQGSCVDGICQCNEGYFGSDCSVEMGIPPVISSVENNGLCDMQERPCAIIRIVAKPITDANNLVCRIKHVLLSEDGQHKLYGNADLIQPAKMLNYKKVECSLPVSPVSPEYTGGFHKTEHGFIISVSLDGENFSEEILLVVYDSLCRACYTNGSCITKESSCLSGGQCYLGDDCVDSGFPNNDLPLDEDETAVIYVDEGDLQTVMYKIASQVEDNVDEMKDILAQYLNFHCNDNPVMCCQAMGFDVESVSETELFQWTDASLCIIEILDADVGSIAVVMSVPVANAELLCGVESGLTEGLAYLDADLIMTVISENQADIEEVINVDVILSATTTPKEPGNNAEQNQNKGTNVAMVGGIIGGCVFLVLAVLAVIIVCKYKKGSTVPNAGGENKNLAYMGSKLMSDSFVTDKTSTKGSQLFQENAWTVEKSTAEPNPYQPDFPQPTVVRAAPPQSTTYDFNQMSIKPGALPHGRLDPLN